MPWPRTGGYWLPPAWTSPRPSPHARRVTDRLVALDPAAPAPPSPGDLDEELRRTGARLWFLAKDSLRTDLMPAFAALADPDREPSEPQSALLAALPARLRHKPAAVEEILRAAEHAAGHQALLAPYQTYPVVVQEEKESAVAKATLAMAGRTLAECVPSGSDRRSPHRRSHGHDPAQQEAQNATPSPHTLYLR